MKLIYLAVLAITFSYACHRKISAAAPVYNTSSYTDPRGNPMLLGTHPAEDLEQPPYSDWFNKNYADYTIDSVTAGRLSPLLKDKTFELYLGTWCGDSKREIPRMLKILRYAGVQPSQIRLVMVDMRDSLYKQSPAHEEKGKDIHKVPDLLVYNHQKEINRIVEEPVVSIEKDLLRIVQGEDYMPSYPGAAYLIMQLKSTTVTALLAGKEKLAADLKPVAHSDADLNSLAWAWMHAGEEEKQKAMLALQINTMLYPDKHVAYDLLGDMHAKLNHKEEAKKLYAKVLELQPTNTKTKDKLAQLEQAP